MVCGGSEHCRPDYRVHRSGFPYYSIEFVARGEGFLKLKGKNYSLSPGDIFAYGPRVSQDIRCNPDRPLVKYFVDFVGSSVHELLKSPAPSPGQLMQTSSPEEILRLFENLIDAGLRATPFSGRICSAILEQLLLRLGETAVSPGTIGTMAFETYQQCRQLIQDHYLQLTGLAEIADHCHVDPAYICRLFARFDHQSPYQYLIRLKMLNAAERLQSPGTLVKQVADELGFGDPFQFSRTFRRMLGVSPRHYLQLRSANARQV